MLSSSNIDVKLNVDFFDIKDIIPKNKTIFLVGRLINTLIMNLESLTGEH